MAETYDVIIVGGGPAGLTAGIYAGRAGLKTLVLEESAIGGQITNVELIEDYPGFADGIPGSQLGFNMMTQVMSSGTEIQLGKVSSLDLFGENKIVITEAGTHFGKTLIIAAGAHPKKLGITGEDKFTGHGVSFCATCDAAFFKGMPVAVIAVDNNGITEALHLTKFASKITIVHHNEDPGHGHILVQKARSSPKIEFLWGTDIEGVEGEVSVQRIRLRRAITSDKFSLDVSGVFVYAGVNPNTDYLRGILPLDEEGHIIVNGKMETGVPGVFAAGDIRQGSPCRISTAVGDGAMAAISASEFIRTTMLRVS